MDQRLGKNWSRFRSMITWCQWLQLMQSLVLCHSLHSLPPPASTLWLIWKGQKVAYLSNEDCRCTVARREVRRFRCHGDRTVSVSGASSVDQVRVRESTGADPGEQTEQSTCHSTAPHRCSIASTYLLLAATFDILLRRMMTQQEGSGRWRGKFRWLICVTDIDTGISIDRRHWHHSQRSISCRWVLLFF